MSHYENCKGPGGYYNSLLVRQSFIKEVGYKTDLKSQAEKGKKVLHVGMMEVLLGAELSMARRDLQSP